jgi:hypothetical protein
MTNPTSNFGWQMPTASDLVTDLPADFEVFGQAVDTSLADLKGGTTDQVLAKNSNTDMDFKWVTSDDANAIQNSIVDAKGDLIAASANDTPARLAVGNNGETLVADSSATTGLRWTATPNATNPVINSSFDIWQRGTSVALPASTSIANSYTADRFQMPNGANQACTVSRQATGDTTNLPNIQYCGRFQRNSGQTGTSQVNPSYNLETADSIPFAGKQITFSFYARAGANFSQASNALGVIMVTGTGTDQNLQFGYAGQTQVINTSATLTTTWQRFTFTTAAALSNSATQLGFYFPWIPTGTAGAADYFEITGIMINVGTTALPYRRNAGTIQGELAACQRYYWRTGGSQVYQGLAFGVGYNSTQAAIILRFPVTMRTVPTTFDFSSLALQRDPSASIYAVTAIANINGNSGGLDAVNLGVTASGQTAGTVAQLMTNNSTSAYIGIGAEL